MCWNQLLLAGLSTGSVYFLTVPSDHTVEHPVCTWKVKIPGATWAPRAAPSGRTSGKGDSISPMPFSFSPQKRIKLYFSILSDHNAADIVLGL